MPIYEYQCEKCRKVSNFLVRDVTKHKAPACPKCGHPNTSRLFSRFAAPSARAKSGAEAPADSGPKGGMPPGDMSDLSALEGLDENDPRSLGRAMRKIAAESGEAMPPEMDEMCRRLESGEDPEKIEQDMGNLMGDEGEGGPGGAGRDDTLYEG
ncbi:MAG: zinc ribbon domain-containing protein [Verrucomicrobiota bacterium]